MIKKVIFLAFSFVSMCVFHYLPNAPFMCKVIIYIFILQKLSLNINFYETSFGNVTKPAFGELFNVCETSLMKVYIKLTSSSQTCTGLTFHLDSLSTGSTTTFIFSHRQIVLKAPLYSSVFLRSAHCLRTDWEVTIMPWGPNWCELFLILYLTLYSTKLTKPRCNSWYFFILYFFTI